MGELARRRQVRLLGVPIRDFVSLQGYFDDMVRELQLIEVGRDESGASSRLADLAVYTQHDIAGTRTVLHAQLAEAEAAGETVTDLRMDLVPVSAHDARALLGLVAEFDAQSRAGVLLTAVSSERSRALLTWMVDEVEGQLLHQREPNPFPGATSGDRGG